LSITIVYPFYFQLLTSLYALALGPAARMWAFDTAFDTMEVQAVSRANDTLSL
jgi:hypothetical protein